MKVTFYEVEEMVGEVARGNRRSRRVNAYPTLDDAVVRQEANFAAGRERTWVMEVSVTKTGMKSTMVVPPRDLS